MHSLYNAYVLRQYIVQLSKTARTSAKHVFVYSNAIDTSIIQTVTQDKTSEL